MILIAFGSGLISLAKDMSGGLGYVQRLNFFIYDYEPLDRIILDAPADESFIHQISFFVKKNVRTNLRGLVGYVDEDTDKNYLCHVPELWETEEWSAGQRILRVKLHLEPTNFFKTFSIADRSAASLRAKTIGRKGASAALLPFS